jgi:hypothetical protein
MAIAAENLETHIYGILAADERLLALVPGGIHDEIGPQDPAMAGLAHLVIASYLPGNDRNLMGDPSKRAWTRFGKLIKSITQGESFAGNYAIMSRVDVLLGGTHAAKVLGIYKSGEVKYVEPDGDLRWNHYGYVYRAIARDG